MGDSHVYHWKGKAAQKKLFPNARFTAESGKKVGEFFSDVERTLKVEKDVSTVIICVGTNNCGMYNNMQEAQANLSRALLKLKNAEETIGL